MITNSITRLLPDIVAVLLCSYLRQLWKAVMPQPSHSNGSGMIAIGETGAITSAAAAATSGTEERGTNGTGGIVTEGMLTGACMWFSWRSLVPVVLFRLAAGGGSDQEMESVEHLEWRQHRLDSVSAAHNLYHMDSTSVLNMQSQQRPFRHEMDMNRWFGALMQRVKSPTGALTATRRPGHQREEGRDERRDERKRCKHCCPARLSFPCVNCKGSSVLCNLNMHRVCTHLRYS